MRESWRNVKKRKEKKRKEKKKIIRLSLYTILFFFSWTSSQALARKTRECDYEMKLSLVDQTTNKARVYYSYSDEEGNPFEYAQVEGTTRGSSPDKARRRARDHAQDCVGDYVDFVFNRGIDTVEDFPFEGHKCGGMEDKRGAAKGKGKFSSPFTGLKKMENWLKRYRSCKEIKYVRDYEVQPDPNRPEVLYKAQINLVTSGQNGCAQSKVHDLESDTEKDHVLCIQY